MQPKDETNHIYYRTWQDLGGNIGIQCTWEECNKQTFWTGKEPYGKLWKDKDHQELGQKDCLNCQAIVKADVLKIENENHQKETEEDICPHPLSQAV